MSSESRAQRNGTFELFLAQILVHFNQQQESYIETWWLLTVAISVTSELQLAPLNHHCFLTEVNDETWFWDMDFF